jgi:AAA+ ATPase superfamily predicted ATPase
MAKFIGRKNELEVLKRFLKKKTASLIVVRGRLKVAFFQTSSILVNHLMESY